MTCRRAGTGIGVALALAAALAGCHEVTESGGPPPVTCIQVAGTWDVVLDLDPQQPGTQLCHVTWQLTQTDCNVAVLAALPCSACFMGSPDCWGAFGQASGTPQSSLRLDWTPQGPCSYDASLEAQSDGATLTGTLYLSEHASGGGCTGSFLSAQLSGLRQ